MVRCSLPLQPRLMISSGAMLLLMRTFCMQLLSMRPDSLEDPRLFTLLGVLLMMILPMLFRCSARMCRPELPALEPHMRYGNHGFGGNPLIWMFGGHGHLLATD